MPGSFEIIVVDNASTDNTVDELSPKYQEVKFIANNYNAGFSAANNQGVAASKEQTLLFLNPDAKLISSDLSKALLVLETSSQALIGPKILNPDGSLQESVIKIPGAWAVFKEALFLTYFFKDDMAFVVKENDFALSGACLLIPRAVFKQLGGFDENLFWMDDVDLCYRARQNETKVVYFKDWSVTHEIGVSSRKNYSSVIANQLISKLKFFRKNNKKSDYFLSIPFIQLHIFLRIILFLFLLPFKEVFRKKWMAYLYTQRVFWRYLFVKESKLF